MRKIKMLRQSAFFLFKINNIILVFLKDIRFSYLVIYKT